MISLNQFKEILKCNHVSLNDIQTLIETYSYFQDMEYKHAFAIIKGAKKKGIWDISKADGYYDLPIYDLVKYHFSDEDQALYAKLNHIDELFKKKYKSIGKHAMVKFDEIIKALWLKVNESNNNFNTNMHIFANENVDKMELLARVYNSISEHTANVNLTQGYVRVADEIILNAVDNRKNVLLQALNEDNVYAFEQFINAITTTDEFNNEDETFSEEEVRKILNKVSILITQSSERKFIGVKSALSEYMNQLLNSDILNQKQKEIIKDKTVKSIFLEGCGSLLTMQPSKIEESTNLLMGKSIRTLIKEARTQDVELNRRQKDRLVMKEMFPHLKITGIKAEHHIYALNSNSSIFKAVNVQTLYTVNMYILESLYKNLGGENSRNLTLKDKKTYLASIGIDMDRMFTGDNIFDIFDTRVFSMFDRTKTNKKQIEFENNIRLLSQYMKPCDIQQIICHNYNFMLQDSEKLQTLLENKNIELNSKIDFENFINDLINKRVSYTQATSDNNAGKSYKCKSSRPDMETIIVELAETGSVKNSFKDIQSAIGNYQKHVMDYSKNKTANETRILLRMIEDYSKLAHLSEDEKKVISDELYYILFQLDDKAKLSLDEAKIIDEEIDKFYSESRRRTKTTNINPIEYRLKQIGEILTDKSIDERYVNFDAIKTDEEKVATTKKEIETFRYDKFKAKEKSVQSQELKMVSATYERLKRQVEKLHSSVSEMGPSCVMEENPIVDEFKIQSEIRNIDELIDKKIKELSHRFRIRRMNGEWTSLTNADRSVDNPFIKKLMWNIEELERRKLGLIKQLTNSTPVFVAI